MGKEISVDNSMSLFLTQMSLSAANRSLAEIDPQNIVAVREKCRNLITGTTTRNLVSLRELFHHGNLRTSLPLRLQSCQIFLGEIDRGIRIFNPLRRRC